MTTEIYRQVAAAFDRAAASYSADYAANPIMAWLYDDTYALLDRLIPPRGRVLEIGCGTGEMALRLATSGRTVVATDISPGMIAAARAAAADHPAGGRVTWHAVPGGEIAGVAAGPFDAAYSNFGPLNCEPQLGQVARSLAELLPPAAPFVCSVMGRICAWEIAWGLLRLRPREALRRLPRGWLQARMSAGPGEAPSTMPVRYYTPGEFARAWAPYFRPDVTLGYPVIIPPPYLAGRFPRAAQRLAGLERRVRGWPGFRSLGDHFLMILRRTEAEP